MTSNVKRHVQLPRSSQKGKKPTAEDLKYGEIAVNFNVEEPFLAMKGSDDSIITMGFKDGKTGPWKKGEGMYAAILDNGTPTSPNEKVNTATGRYATAEGKATTANKDCTHAEGNMTTASGESSHAEGMESTASGYYSHAEGKSTTASGETSHAEGGKTTARGGYSHSEGFHTTASGDTSHAEGNYTTVNGTNSHGEGNYKQELKLVKDISIGDTKIFINFQEMSIIANDDYLKNCYIVNNDKSYKIKGYEVSYDFTSSALELTLDKPLEKASTNDNPTEETFISEEYKFINIAVEDVDAGHSEGKYNMVLGESGHAEGKCNIAIGNGSHVEGKNNIAEGINSHVEGSANAASGENAHAEGISTIASGDTSHSEGRFTKALGGYSHAEGDYAIAMGDTSHAEGYETNAEGMYSHVEGKGSIALGNATHVEGLHRQAMNFTDDVTIGATEIFILASEDYSVNLDYYKNCLIKGGGVSIDVISAEYAYNTKFTESNENKRIKLTLKEALPKACTRAEQTADNQKDGYFSTQDYQIHNKGTIENYGGHAEGSYTMVYEDSGHAEGKLSIAKGKISHAEGYRTIAGGQTSHAEGNETIASGNGSHAEGAYNTASGECSHAEGASTTASGGASHAEGNECTASGLNSHAEGNKCTASGLNSHAEGQGTTANGTNSHTSGSYTTAENNSEFACGKYNKFNVNQIFSIGVGTADNARKNALYVTTDGVIGGDSQLTNGGTSMFGLKINGGIQASEGMIAPTYLNSSDERLKKNIETISDNDIDKVKNVDLKSYVFKSDNSKHYGVIAQDVEKAGLSELVTNGADGMKSVDYISLLILKIAELENEIKNLKDQIKK